ncbi:MAG: hypothetical protein R2792_13440 [Saprospiraceae bacterium]
MSVIEKLASSLGRRDEVPNQDLAREIATQADSDAVLELLGLLQHKSKDVQNDSIKVLYEIGALRPDLVAPHLHAFAALLSHKNNRLQWGGMTAIAAITPEVPDAVYNLLPQILDAAQKGSVITKDNAVLILIALCNVSKYETAAFDLLLEQIQASPDNQLPMYAERALPVAPATSKKQFAAVLESRLPEIEKESKRKRLEKVLKKLAK